MRRAGAWEVWGALEGPLGGRDEGRLPNMSLRVQPQVRSGPWECAPGGGGTRAGTGIARFPQS